MTTSDDEPRDWKESVADWVWARWGWLVVGVLLVFALNNLVGVVVGTVGFIAFANRVAGRLLKARRVVQQVRETVADSAEPPEPVDPTGD